MLREVNRKQAKILPNSHDYLVYNFPTYVSIHKQYISNTKSKLKASCFQVRTSLHLLLKSFWEERDQSAGGLGHSFPES